MERWNGEEKGEELPHRGGWFSEAEGWGMLYQMDVLDPP